MKPRLESAPLTPEDFRIWDRLMDPPPPREGISAVDYVTADRRDADLMLHTQQIASFGPAAIELYDIPCRGWTQK